MMDWTPYYPAYKREKPGDETMTPILSKDITVADIGCGFGGLLVALSPVLPDQLLLGKYHSC
jgi:tRNA (guanine-N7-)-methyltransferase